MERDNGCTLMMAVREWRSGMGIEICEWRHGRATKAWVWWKGQQHVLDVRGVGTREENGDERKGRKERDEWERGKETKAEGRRTVPRTG